MERPYENGAVMLVREGRITFAIPLDEHGSLRPLPSSTEPIIWRMRAGDRIETAGATASSAVKNRTEGEAEVL